MSEEAKMVPRFSLKNGDSTYCPLTQDNERGDLVYYDDHEAIVKEKGWLLNDVRGERNQLRQRVAELEALVRGVIDVDGEIFCEPVGSEYWWTERDRLLAPA